MENNLTTELKPIQYTKGIIKFDAFDEYVKQATAVAMYINSLELTQDNIKMVKKDLADAKKVVNGLETKRKEIKRAMLEPYNELEKQIKQLTSIIDEADENLRKQVRLLEEQERATKKQNLEIIFNNRLQQYPDIESIIPEPFNRFIQPQMLNKTMTLKKVEDMMVQWLEQRQTEITTINDMDDSDVMVEYIKTLSITQAIQTVQADRTLKAQIVTQTLETNKNVTESEIEPNKEWVTVSVLNWEVVEQLFKQYHITYVKQN